MDQLRLTAGAPASYSFTADPESQAEPDLSVYVLKAALTVANGRVICAVTEANGITKTATSFSVSFTASQTRSCESGTYLSVQFWLNGAIAAQEQVVLLVQPNFIP